MITYFQSNKILDKAFGNVDYQTPNNYYIGLSTTAPNPSGTGVTEPSVGAYARISVNNNKTSFSTTSNGVLYNSTQFEFPESTTSWGTITHVFIADAQNGGNILYYDALTTARQVQAQTSLIFIPNSIKIQLS